MLPGWQILLMVGGFLAVVWGILVWPALWLQKQWEREARRRAEEWANQEGYELISLRMSLWGGFRFLPSQMGQLWRIEVRDKSGRSLKGWMRVGNWVAGWASDKVTVKWKA